MRMRARRKRRDSSPGELRGRQPLPDPIKTYVLQKRKTARAEMASPLEHPTLGPTSRPPAQPMHRTKHAECGDPANHRSTNRPTRLSMNLLKLPTYGAPAGRPSTCRLGSREVASTSPILAASLCRAGSSHPKGGRRVVQRLSLANWAMPLRTRWQTQRRETLLPGLDQTLLHEGQ